MVSPIPKNDGTNQVTQRCDNFPPVMLSEYKISMDFTTVLRVFYTYHLGLLLKLPCLCPIGKFHRNDVRIEFVLLIDRN